MLRDTTYLAEVTADSRPTCQEISVIVNPPRKLTPAEAAQARTEHTWTELRVLWLKQLWAEGHSASQIAAQMDGITRNAVIGKAHRLGLSGRAKNNTPRPRVPRTRKTRIRDTERVYRARKSKVALAFELEGEEYQEPVEELEIPTEQRRTLLQLGDATCHWPVGDPCKGDFFFCGGKTLGKLPYCAHHSRVSYQTPAQRADDKIDRRSREYRETVGRSFVYAATFN